MPYLMILILEVKRFAVLLFTRLYQTCDELCAILSEDPIDALNTAGKITSTLLREVIDHRPSLAPFEAPAIRHYKSLPALTTQGTGGSSYVDRNNWSDLLNLQVHISERLGDTWLID